MTTTATVSGGTGQTLTTLFKNNIREYGMLIALIAVMVFFQFQTGGILFKPVNITNLVLQNSYVITMALGMLLIIVSGWIDLSVGSVVAVIGALAGVLMVRYHVDWVVTVAICLAGRRRDRGFSGLLGRIFKNPGLHCYSGRHVDLSRSDFCSAPG